MTLQACTKNKWCFLVNGHEEECSDKQSWDNAPTNYRPLKLTKLGCLAICFLFCIFLLVAFILGGKDEGTAPGNYCIEFPEDSVCQGVK